MSTELVYGSVEKAGSRPEAVVALRTARSASRSGLLWGYVFGIVVATSALGYASTYKTYAQRLHFAALFASNAGLAAINGPAHALTTVAGYMVWKSFMSLIVIGGVWGLLTSTRLMRGEEEGGRWELLLAGPTTRREAAGEALVGLGVGLVVLLAVTAAVTVFVGRSSKVHVGTGSALFFSVALAASPALFLAAGALCSQLAATRRRAAGYAGAALGICYALRLVADSGTGLEWLRWATPLGWIEELEPVTHPRPALLLPIVALVVVLCALTVHLAGSRDLGGSIVADRDHASLRPTLLSGPWTLTVRLVRPTVLTWAAAIGAISLLMGFIAKQGGSALTSSPSIEKVVARLGARGAGAAAYLGFVFIMVAAMICFVAVAQVVAARSEEADGRLENLITRPLSRVSWMGSRIVIGLAVLLCGGLTAGLFAWFGAESAGSGLKLHTLLAAGVNLAPPAACVFGFGMLAMGVIPRITTIVTYGIVTWSLLIELLGGIFGSSSAGLEDTSVFHYVTAAPATSPDWTSAAALVGVGLTACLLGTAAFCRRDLVGR